MIDPSLANDPEFKALVRMFVGDLEPRLQVLLRARDAGLWEQVAEAAHKIAGSAGGFGFDALGECARDCEQVVRTAGNVTDANATDAIDALVQQIHAVVASVQVQGPGADPSSTEAA